MSDTNTASVVDLTSASSDTKEKTAKTQAKSAPEKKSSVYLRARNLGVYEILEEVVPFRDLLPSLNFLRALESFSADWTYFKRFAVECYNISPRLITLSILTSLASSLIPATTFYFSGNLLSAVCHFLGFIKSQTLSIRRI